MKASTKENVVIWIIVASILAMIVWGEMHWWGECLRVHPSWYCYTESQKK